ncbi:hypothetical protein RRG08_028026 [Elysia crispata]|uniref:Uncharacterized protein n=1 Tax=Elysia crispata TaxID=231223 RepID=A0AAE1BD25_9GAST|nr:hypothetical protein RRG08_028026 [Elysia crispata]
MEGVCSSDSQHLELQDASYANEPRELDASCAVDAEGLDALDNPREIHFSDIRDLGRQNKSNKKEFQRFNVSNTSDKERPDFSTTRGLEGLDAIDTVHSENLYTSNNEDMERPNVSDTNDKEGHDISIRGVLDGLDSSGGLKSSSISKTIELKELEKPGVDHAISLNDTVLAKKIESNHPNVVEPVLDHSTEIKEEGKLNITNPPGSNSQNGDADESGIATPRSRHSSTSRSDKRVRIETIPLCIMVDNKDKGNGNNLDEHYLEVDRGELPSMKQCYTDGESDDKLSELYTDTGSGTEMAAHGVDIQSSDWWVPSLQWAKKSCRKRSRRRWRFRNRTPLKGLADKHAHGSAPSLVAPLPSQESRAAPDVTTVNKAAIVSRYWRLQIQPVCPDKPLQDP